MYDTRLAEYQRGGIAAAAPERTYKGTGSYLLTVLKE
jgi:hypothetical protein